MSSFPSPTRDLRCEFLSARTRSVRFPDALAIQTTPWPSHAPIVTTAPSWSRLRDSAVRLSIEAMELIVDA